MTPVRDPSDSEDDDPTPASTPSRADRGRCDIVENPSHSAESEEEEEEMESQEEEEADSQGEEEEEEESQSNSAEAEELEEMDSQDNSAEADEESQHISDEEEEEEAEEEAEAEEAEEEAEEEMSQHNSSESADEEMESAEKKKGKKLSFAAQCARMVVTCCSCKMPRVVFSRYRLGPTHIEDVEDAGTRFVCGSQLSCGNVKLNVRYDFVSNPVYMRELGCQAPVEYTYYVKRLAAPPVCAHCARGEGLQPLPEDLVQGYRMVLPLCYGCADYGWIHRYPIRS